MGIWHSVPPENMVFDVPPFRSDPSLGEVLHEKQFELHFDPQLLGFWWS